MAKKIEKILVITSGGDAPGMNAAIRAVVRTAMHYDISVYGSCLGFRGLTEDTIFPLTAESVANCLQRGGTILKSTRYPEFKDATIRAKAAQSLQQEGIDALIVLGGDGSFRGATLLAQESDIAVIGIPCTIDNDIRNTEYTIGFDTACNTALQAIDRIRDTAFSHNRHFLVEVMGRATGFLAVEVGIAGGAEFVLIPETPLSIDDLVTRIQQRKRTKLGSIIVVAEGEKAGRSIDIANQLNQQLNIEYKVCILGHTQRGGSPTMRDRKLAALMGVKSVMALRDGVNQKMLAFLDGKVTLADFPAPEAGPRHFHDADLLHVNQVLCDL